MKQLILECDLGNSRFKWRTLRDGGIELRGAGDYDTLDFSVLAGVGCFDRVRIASVASAHALNQFCSALPKHSLAPEIATSQIETAGVRNAYGDNYQSLGVDRWAAVVAAYRRCSSAVLVLDAGSALTADLVDAAGNHLGGYIAPGSHLMRSSLFGDTEQVRFDLEASAADLDFGVCTQQAVDGGVLAALVGFASVAIDQASRRIPQGFAILVTGGGAALLMPHLPDHAQFEADLVLDGLAWLLP